MPQPVDLQTELARVTAAERIQQSADRASLAAQQRAASTVEQTRVNAETQVQQTVEAESEQIDQDGRRKNPFVGRRRRRAKEEIAGPTPPASAGDLKVIPEGTEKHELDITI
ncbi:MAG: hypothetical protein IT365_00905 [Candidatus Hydrogenedentes bacterium]|nr:hypothetical protein [Candidatus Hydrogenedentota bacterium]